MPRIWAPWRKAYIKSHRSLGDKCLFCRLFKEKKDSKNYIIKRSAKSFALLNLYPYNNGHVLILPYRHVQTIDQLSDDEKLDWLHLYEEVNQALKECFNPQGFNVGVNLGSAAGAGIPQHLHMHIVPRWSGDCNFMPVIGSTKVISESLDSVYEMMHRHMTGESKKTSSKKSIQTR